MIKKALNVEDIHKGCCLGTYIIIWFILTSQLLRLLGEENQSWEKTEKDAKVALTTFICLTAAIASAQGSPYC